MSIGGCTGMYLPLEGASSASRAMLASMISTARFGNIASPHEAYNNELNQSKIMQHTSCTTLAGRKWREDHQRKPQQRRLALLVPATAGVRTAS